MLKKILSFVCNNDKFLTLRNNPKDPKHGGDFWFVVTGAVESGESYDEAVRREVKEETNLNTIDIFPLNWGSIYTWRGKDCEEHNFVSFVKSGKIVLNEEHIEYAWLEPGDFIKKIRWEGDKKKLQKILKKALKKKPYFETLQMEDCR